ncbi:MAG: nucleotidyltransferase domain-containing protein, partial [Anaerolineae bacterium]
MTQTLTLDRVLTERERQAIAEFQERLHRTLPGQVQSLILFGSKAREDAHPDSDIDLLVILRDKTRATVDAVVEAQLEALDQTGVFVTPLIYSQQEAEEDQALGMPLMQNVAEEGIVVWGEPIMVNEVRKKEVAQEYLASARDRLRSATLLLENDLYRDAVSRAFYAMLDAADALLVVKGLTPKSH